MRVELRTLPIEHVDQDQIGSPDRAEIDLTALEADLKSTIRGEVRFDAGTRGMYAHDASNYRMPPLGVVLVRDKQDAVAAIAAARRAQCPVIGRGGGTSIPGQGVNYALMLDFSKYMDRVLKIDASAKAGTVEPGCILDMLREAAELHGLTFGPDPATHSRNTLGGMVGNNSCGIHSVMAGRTVDNIRELEVLLYDGTIMRVGETSPQELENIIAAGGRRGEIYAALRDLRDRYADLIRERFPNIPRRVSGFNLDQLLPENNFNVARALVGSEGACVIILEIVADLVYSPPSRSLLVLGFPDLGTAGDWVPRCLKAKPIGLEGIENDFFEDIHKKGMRAPGEHMLPPGAAWLLVEFGGKTKKEADDNARALMTDLKGAEGAPAMVLFDDPTQEANIWFLREEGLGATAKVPGKKENHEGWEDTAVSPDEVGPYIRDFKKLLSKYDYTGTMYGHLGDGCVHIRLDFDLQTAEGIAHYRAFAQEGADLVARYHGSLSGEHGDGQAKGELLERMYGPELIQAFVEFKRIWDPDWKMNPGKIIAPYPLDDKLTLGADYDPAEPETYFKYPTDDYSFAKVSRRCVGAGVCRRHHGGTMCPSYMVTHEEKYSTRGRSRLLFEMIEGDLIKDGWESEEVKDALDLCLACKGCKGECPVQVDMATYKAEFLAHYYRRKPRPRQAYAFGFIQVWARFAALAPGFLNLTTHLPGLKSIAKFVAGIDSRRDIPKFAPVTFKSWFAKRRPERITGRKVILWADTFNNHFHPTTARAAVEVLEDAGFDVHVPMGNLCCGRPLYDYGFLDQARAYLERILDALRPDIHAGTPIVVLEPSCLSVFRDELINLLAHDEDAHRLSNQTFTLAQFLDQNGYKPPKLKRKALLHGHCHQKALIGIEKEAALLREMGLDVQVPDSGCCGMAGAFGFEAGDHYEVAIACGERVLLPEVRDVEDETLIVSDGFSCREQVQQDTDRTPLHFAQVVQMALREGERGAPGPKPETAYVKPPRDLVDDAKTVVLAGACLYAAWKLASWAIQKLT